MSTKKKDHENFEEPAAMASVLLMVLTVLTVLTTSSVSLRTIEFFIISKSFVVSSEFSSNVTLDWHASNNLHGLIWFSLNSWSSVFVVSIMLAMLALFAMLAMFAMSTLVASSSESWSLRIFTLELEIFFTKSLWRWRWSFSLSVLSSSSHSLTHSIKHLEETEMVLFFCINIAALENS